MITRREVSPKCIGLFIQMGSEGGKLYGARLSDCSRKWEKGKDWPKPKVRNFRFDLVEGPDKGESEFVWVYQWDSLDFADDPDEFGCPDGNLAVWKEKGFGA